MNPAIEFDTCPRCGSFELVVGEEEIWLPGLRVYPR